MIVGLSLMNSSSCKTSVNPPKISTMTAVTTGMTAICRVMA
jgi:hypothetical protein